MDVFEYNLFNLKKSLPLWKGNDNNIPDCPKICSCINIINYPQGVIQELNQLIFRFLWKGVEKVTRLSAINDYEKSGLKIISTWKNYLHHILESFGGPFLFHCNYNIKELTISFQVYTELSAEKLWHNIIWDNKDICIDNKPVFYKTFFESGIRHVTDLWFDLNITESYTIITKKMKKANSYFGMGWS